MTTTAAMNTTEAQAIYCYSYQRISTKNQLKGGGIKRQHDLSAAFCAEKGWVMDTTFSLTDVGTSAYHSKNLDSRAALGSFLNAVDNGLIRKPAVLLVESLDRISRANIMEALELFIRILNSGISICTYMDRMIYSKESIQSNFGPLLISITIMCRAHEESEIKSKRIKTGWQHIRDKIKAGKIAHKGIYPQWIDISTGKPVVIENEAEKIREVFDLCINKNMSYAAISKHLTEKYNGKFKVSPPLLKRIFHSKRVLGIYEPHEANTSGRTRVDIPTNELIHAFPAIIDEETYYAAKAAIKKRMYIGTGRPPKKEINFFRRTLQCSGCGYAISMATTTTSKPVYRCWRKLRNHSDCKQKSVIQVTHFQPILLYAISLIDKDDMLESAANSKKVKLSKAINNKQVELEDKKTRKDNLAKLVAAGSETGVEMVVELENEIKPIRQEIESMKNQLEMLNSPTMAASIDHANEFGRKFILGQATKDDQEPFSLALRNLIEKIVIHSPENTRQRTIAVIHLLSGIDIKVVVEKDYSAEIFKGKKRIGRFAPKG